MTELVKPSILMVDDDPDSLRALQNHMEPEASVEVLHPSDVALNDLTHADLVLVDYRLKDWPGRDSVSSIALQPLNGLALAAVLRAHLETKKGSPTAFAIHSGHLPDLSGPLPPDKREHTLARANNLEWVFSKGAATGSKLTRQVVSLACAVRDLPTSWPADSADASRRQLKHLLDISDHQPWSERAWEDVEGCHPPIHELSSWTHGLAVLRWLLQRILPYPCFLWDTNYLSTRLRVTPASLTAALKSSGHLDTALESFRYSGILAAFLGQRWWRSGIEAFLWDATDGRPFDPDCLHSALESAAGCELEQLACAQPVVCLDENYQPLPECCEIAAAVRIQPDDWPAYANDAWTTIALANQEPRLGALVVNQDRERLNTTEEL